jgi:PKD repeat protein
MVRFTDTSGGSPESWLWSFGDGESSTSQHPVHVYQAPGVYPVSLTVRNPYGTNTLSEEGAIAVGMTPAAGFSAAPREGTAPLSVRFTDLSRGSPDQWSWNFGDGSGASEKNPAHMYLDPGDYSVSLTVSSQFGSNTRIQSNYIRITAPRMTEVSLFGSRTGSLLPGGYLQFVVTGTGGPIKIAGSEYPIRTGDLVQLFPDNVNTGEIDVNERGLTRFSFSNVRLFVNGELRRTGTVSDVTIAGISGVQSTFTISVPEGDADTVLFADGAKINNRELAAITISGLMPDRAGRMYLSQRTGDLTYRGGASGLSVGEQ